MKLSSRALFGAVMACLFLSGMAGLVYEIVWARYLALFLGHTSYAIVAVLVAFMGGLALGNVFAGWVADRTRRPLVWYAWLELGIGVYALLFPFWYGLCHEMYVGLARGFHPGGSAALALKFAFSLGAILLPTVLMGGTLPFLARLLTRSIDELRGNVAALYCVNSVGAVVGAWLGGFYLVPSVGLEFSMYVGAVINLGVGALAFVLAAKLPETVSEKGAGGGAVRGEAQSTEVPRERFSPAELRLAVIAIGLSGFVAMLYQVAWTRLLALALGSSTHAFSLMLITFIAGIAVGSWLIYRWAGGGKTLRAFGWVEIALAAALAAAIFTYEFLPFWFAQMANLLARKPEAYPLYALLQGMVCFGVMFVPTVCLGMTLPLASRVATAEVDRTGRAVGGVFAVNTLGTVLGAGLTGLVLLPWLGLARTFALGIGLNILIGVAILARGKGTAAWWSRWLPATAVLAALVFLAGASLDRTWRGALTMGLWRVEDLGISRQQFREEARSADLRYYRDGAGSTVSVQELVGSSSNLVLRVNGKPEASSTKDMATQLLIGHLPMLLRPATSVLVVGIGSGVTAGAVSLHPTLERLDIVEISPEVVAAARYFEEINHRVLDNPKTRVFVEDAKSFLQITSQEYDAIVSEPSNPWMAGVAGVFSVEYYLNCRDRLKPDGLMAQWVQIYEFSDEAFDTVLASFREVFPHVGIWYPQMGDVLLIGSVEPLAVDLDSFLARLAVPEVQTDLETVHRERPAVLLSFEVVSPENGAFLAPEEARIHSDFFPTLEYRAQRDFFTRGVAFGFNRVNETLSPRPTTLLGRYLERSPLTREDYRAFTRLYADGNEFTRAAVASILLRWQREDPEAVEPIEFAAQYGFLKGVVEAEAVQLAGRTQLILTRSAENPLLLRQYGLALLRTYRNQRSAFYLPSDTLLASLLEQLTQYDSANQRVYQAYLCELAWERGDDEACLDWGRLAFAGDLERGPAKFRLDRGQPAVAVARMADSLQRQGLLREAVLVCEEAVRAGYLTEEVGDRALLFEMTRRKLRNALLQRMTAEQGLGSRSGPE